jgi:hypothetical protein
MSPRAAQVRIYVDADVLRRGKILADLRGDVTYPGAPGAVIHKRQRAHLTHHDDLDHTRLGRARNCSPRLPSRPRPGRARLGARDRVEAYRFRRQLYYATCAILVSIPSSYSEGVRYPSPF